MHKILASSLPAKQGLARIGLQGMISETSAFVLPVEGSDISIYFQRYFHHNTECHYHGQEGETFLVVESLEKMNIVWQGSG